MTKEMIESGCPVTTALPSRAVSRVMVVEVA
jgi:hypothetical protein